MIRYCIIVLLFAVVIRIDIAVVVGEEPCPFAGRSLPGRAGKSGEGSVRRRDAWTVNEKDDTSRKGDTNFADLLTKLIGGATELETSDSNYELYQNDFDIGTFRITNPGTYKIMEDIEFCPQADNDYWPTADLWDEYPPASYYLGFFAAITVESDDVEIDLNGHTIQQCPQFYLLQRFFNVIELNNRIFISNEGVSSLNYQSTDRPVGGDTTAGNVITPSSIIIKNGSIGRSSHAGIHGNSITGLKIENLSIQNFEVAGIHCNGCKDVEISNCVVGPSAQRVPVLATFSNARFLEFYTQRLIPEGFQNEPISFRQDLFDLFNTTISFADRQGSPITLQGVFNRLSDAITLFRAYNNGEDTSSLSHAETSLLEEARGVFENPSGLTDGSVQYGIVFNHRGVPKPADGFNGPGAETANIVIRDTTITQLHANPIEVLSLMTEEGSHMQGPARDLIRIYDITTDRMRTLLDSRYKGNFLSDVYFALWQLSNDFYRIRVLNSTCGNFGSNASFPYNLKTYPSGKERTCSELGTFSDPSITGREVTMLQKQYFGGLQISQGLYDWATTPGFALDALIATPTYPDHLRSGARHKIVCDHDTMFHPFQGVIALRFVEAKTVKVINVDITDVVNIADEKTWSCRNKWQLQSTREDVRVVTADSSSGAMIRGIEIIRSEDMEFDAVAIEGLRSEEGLVVGIDISGSGDGQTDNGITGISFKDVAVENLLGHGGTIPFKSVATNLALPSGINVGRSEEASYTFLNNNPRVVMNYQITNARSPRDQANDSIPIITNTNQKVVMDDIKAVSTFDTNEKLNEYKRKVLAFYKERFGLRFDEPAVYDEDDFLKPIRVLDQDGLETDSVIKFGQVSPDNGLHATSMCLNTDRDKTNNEIACHDLNVSMAHSFAFIFLPGPSGYTLYGAYGSNHGKYCPELNVILVGFYVFEQFELVNEQTANFQVEYYAESPTVFQPFYGGSVSWYSNYNLWSDLFGKGVASGAFIATPDGAEWKINGHPTMIFDDQQLNHPIKKSLVVSTNHLDPKRTELQTSYLIKQILLLTANDTKFSFVADGKISTRLTSEISETAPFGHDRYFHNGKAALQYLRTKTSFETDEKIAELRTQFLSRLRDDFGIATITPDYYDDIPLDGIIDLGGGNTIRPYVVNDSVNQRVMTKQYRDGKDLVVQPVSAARLREGGFRLVVGRAGIDTRDGRYPFGSMFTEGIYILENSDSDDDLEIQFYSKGPIQWNGWATSVVYNQLWNDFLGHGRLYALVPPPTSSADGSTLLFHIRGALLFGNQLASDA